MVIANVAELSFLHPKRSIFHIYMKYNIDDTFLLFMCIGFLSEVYSEPRQSSKMKLHVWLGSEYAFVFFM